jgi:hypothetical protein
MSPTQLKDSLAGGYKFVAYNGAVSEFLDPVEKLQTQVGISHFRVPTTDKFDHTMYDLRIEAYAVPPSAFLHRVAGTTLQLDRDRVDESHCGPASVWQIDALNKRYLTEKYAESRSQSTATHEPSLRGTRPSPEELREYKQGRKRGVWDKTGPLDITHVRELKKRFLDESERITLVTAATAIQMDKGKQARVINPRFLSNNRHPDLEDRKVGLITASQGSEQSVHQTLLSWHIASKFYNEQQEAENKWVSIITAVLDTVLRECEAKAFTSGVYGGFFDMKEVSEWETDEVTANHIQGLLEVCIVILGARGRIWIACR